MVNFQGQLVDPTTGNPKPDGAYSMTFRIYNTASGGTQLWFESQTVTVTGGLFNVFLGSSTALSASVFSSAERWLQVEVGGQVLIPRQRLASVPYALQAEEAKNASSVPWSGITGMPAGFADGTDNDTTYSAGSGLTLTGTTFAVQFGGTGSATTVARSDHNHDATYVNEGQTGSVTSDMIVNGTIVDADISSTAAIAPSKISGTAWTGANDGAGSGLDADLLDGQHASAFAAASHTHSSTSISDEPGIAFDNWPYLSALNSTTWIEVTHVNITAPGAGYVLVQAAGDIEWLNYTGGRYVYLGIGTTPTSTSNSSYMTIYGLPSGQPSGTHCVPMALSWVYQVSAGSYTYYLNASVNATTAGSDKPYINVSSFQALYFPSAYGTANLTKAGAQREGR